MKKRLISAVIAASLMGSALGINLTASAAYGNETITNNFEGYAAGAAVGGAFAHFDKGTLTCETNDEAKNPDGGKITVKFSQGTSDCSNNTLFWNVGKNDMASYGDCRIIFDLYRTSTAYDFSLNQKSINYAAAEGWNYNGIGGFMTFAAGGTLNVFGTGAGTYEPGLYRIAVDYLRTQNKMTVTLLSGKLNGENKQDHKLGEKAFTNTASSAVSAIYFVQNNAKAATSTDGMVDYIDNINRYALPNTWTSADFTADGNNNYAEAGITTISFVTPRFVDTTTMSGVKLVKNGAEEIGCTVTYANTVTNYSYACDPTFTFAAPLEAGEYTLQLGEAKDNYGQAIPDVSFTVLGSEDDCSISSVAGDLTLSGDVIGNVVKGTTPDALLEMIDIAVGAEAEISDVKYLFGGEALTVTSANKKYTKTYTIETKADLYSYDFNNAKLDTELASNEIPNAANRNGNPGAALGKAFPNAGFAQFWSIDTNTAGTAQITGAEASEKSDRVGAISLIDYVNAQTGNIRMSATLYSNTESDKHYAVNISVKPVKGELTKVFLLKKDHNGTIIGDVQFDDSVDFAIESAAASIKKNDIDDWYNITFDYIYDSTEKKYIVKSFVNGEYVTVKETSGDTYETGIGIGLEFYVPIKTEAVTKSMYFDNLSAYECAAMQGNDCPYSTFVPTSSASDVWLKNIAGRVSVVTKDADEIVSGLNLPSGVTASVIKPDGTARTGNAETGDRVIIKDGENIRTYYIDCGRWSKDAQTTSVAYKFPADIENGAWILGVYEQNNVLKASVIGGEDGKLVYNNDSDNTYKVFLWNGISTMLPLSNPAGFIGE